MKGFGLTVAVVLATHNGERFLGQLLASLASQTRPPDELIIHDDVSGDATVQIIEAFARVAPFPVTLLRGSTRQGHAAAFLAAAARCRSDLLAFCDQDDVWMSEKLDRCVREFEHGSGIVLVVHAGRVIGDRGRWTTKRYPSYRRRRVTTPHSTPLAFWAPGFAMVVSRPLLEVWDVSTGEAIEKFGEPGWWGHDTWLSFVGASLGVVVSLPDPFVHFRQHDENLHGAPRLKVLDVIDAVAARRGTEIQNYVSIATRARSFVALVDELTRRVEDMPTAARRGITTGGLRVRAARWARQARANERRAVLYAADPLTRSALSCVLEHLFSGDYGRQDYGGLGLVSLGRDVLYVAGLLDPVVTAGRHLRRKIGSVRRTE